MMYPYDPTRAKKLLTDAGVGSGLSLDVYAYQLPGLPEGKTMAEAVAGYWEKLGIKTRLIPVDYPAFRKAWFDRTAPGAVGYFNIANRDWIGAYALLEKQAYSASKPSDTVNDAEIDGMLSQVMRQTDREKINALMRNVYTRLRSEHYGVPGLPALAVRDVQEPRQVERGQRHVRPVLRPARLREITRTKISRKANALECRARMIHVVGGHGEERRRSPRFRTSFEGFKR